MSEARNELRETVIEARLVIKERDVAEAKLTGRMGQFERNIDQERAASDQRMFSAIKHDEQMDKAPCWETL